MLIKMIAPLNTVPIGRDAEQRQPVLQEGQQHHAEQGAGQRAAAAAHAGAAQHHRRQYRQLEAKQRVGATDWVICACTTAATPARMPM